ncbi:MAG: hypothetical protein JW882_02030 [Deltaproteobacteria bacterium]|nr:hypothetical protein [Deltaproteobacteria bacterium]
MEKAIIDLIKDNGPLTGEDILSSLGEDPLLVWRTCRGSDHLVTQSIGTRYLRFDRRIEGYARLSPSILREFLTYSVVGLSENIADLDKKAGIILSHIKDVSKAKSDLAYNIVSSLTARLGDDPLLKEQLCFIIAGDIVFNMAHDVPRPERSTGKIVKGSDMDIVVVLDDLFPESVIKRLDEEIYAEKHRLLLNPYIKEEIDYIVKGLDRIRDQVRFDTFKHMVACKILQEGTLLYGSSALFREIKTILKEYNIMEKITAMEKQATAFREKAEEYLLSEDPIRIRESGMNLFYPAEESEEFE